MCERRRYESKLIEAFPFATRIVSRRLTSPRPASTLQTSNRTLLSEVDIGIVAGRQIALAIADDLPLVYVDPSMIESALGQLIENVRATRGCLLARMSGSGATCFALYASEAERNAASAQVQAQRPEWWQMKGKLR